MRVTHEMMVGASLGRLSTRLGRYERAQSQLATGRRMLAPSDDPAGTGRALALRASQRSREQEARNAADAMSWLDIADSQLQAASGRLDRVNQLTIRGASELAPGERTAIAAEVNAIAEELRSIADVRHRGVPLFAGYADPSQVVAHDGAGWVYRGDGGAITRRVGDQEVVQVNVTAAEIFGLDGAPSSENTFALLDDIVAYVQAGDVAGMQAAIGRLTTAREQLSASHARIGAAANRVESAQRRGGDALLTLRAELAQVEDVDLAEASMELATQEVAYQATLAAMAKALPPSLVTFLR